MRVEERGEKTAAQTIDFVEVSDPQPYEVVAVIPAYNEERFIGSVVLGAAQYVHTVLIVDDGSTDDTAAIAAAANAKVISMETNSGKGAALRRGIERALQHENVEAIVLMDGDGQHSPKELPEVIRPILEGSADMVVGSRFLEIQSEIPWWRQIGQHGLTWVTNAASGVALTDSQSGFRAISPKAAVLLTQNQGNGFSVESEMQFIIKENGLRVQEVPISCNYAEPPKRNPIIHGMQVLDGILRLVSKSRPALFFGVPAIVLLVAGLLMSKGLLEIYNATHQFSPNHAVITLMLVLLGTVFLLSGLLLHSIRSLLVRMVKYKPLETAP
jgi:glycosyltransferase involved in cell wall biosynthesis